MKDVIRGRTQGRDDIVVVEEVTASTKLKLLQNGTAARFSLAQDCLS
jgi:hypothetical protein